MVLLPQLALLRTTTAHELLLKDIPLQARRQARTPRIYEARPRIRHGVHDDQPDGHPEIPAEASADLQWGAGDHFAVLFDVGGEADAEEHPDEDSAQDGAVGEVDGEGVLAEPEEVFVAEEGFEGRGEVDAQHYELKANAGVVSWEVGVVGEDGLAVLHHFIRPGAPLGVFLGVGGQEEAEDEEEGGEDAAGPGASGEPGRVRGCLREVGEEGAKEELHAEGAVVTDEVVNVHAQRDHHAVAGFHVPRGEEEDVDHEGAFEEGLQRPLVLVVGVPAAGPGGDEVEGQVLDGAADVGRGFGRGEVEPEAINTVADGEKAELAEQPGDDGSDGGGEHEARGAAEGGLGNSDEGVRGRASAELADGLESADEASDEGEDGNTNAALH